MGNGVCWSILEYVLHIQARWVLLFLVHIYPLYLTWMYSLLYIGYHYQYYYFLSQPLCLANNNGPLLHIPMHQLAVKVEAYPHPVQQQHQHYCPSSTTMMQHDPPIPIIPKWNTTIKWNTDQNTTRFNVSITINTENDDKKFMDSLWTIRCYLLYCNE